MPLGWRLGRAAGSPHAGEGVIHLSTPATPVSVVTDAATGMSDDLLGVAGVGLGIGATIFVLRKGWRLLKGFTS